MPPRPREPTPYQRFMRRIHDHPQARFLEFLLWGIPGALLLLAAWGGWRADWVSTPISLMIALVGIVLIGWGLIPPPTRPEPQDTPSPRSKRRAR